MKYISNNITVVLNQDMDKFIIRRTGGQSQILPLKHIDELRDLLNDIIEERDSF